MKIPAKIKKPKQITNKKNRLKAVGLVLACTFLSSAAEILWKSASESVVGIASFVFNLNVILGFMFYALAAVFLVLALSKDELSILYPMLSLTFVWGFIFAVFFLGEQIYLSKLLGFGLIIIGVSVLGASK